MKSIKAATSSATQPSCTAIRYHVAVEPWLSPEKLQRMAGKTITAKKMAKVVKAMKK